MRIFFDSANNTKLHYNLATLSHDFLFTCKTLCLMYSKWLGGMKNSLRIFCFTFQQTIVCKEGRLFCILRTGAFHSTFLQKMCQKHQKLCHGHWLKKVVVCSPLFSMTLKVIWWKYALTYYTVFGIFHQSLLDQNSKYLHFFILFFSESGFMCMEVYRKADTIMSLKLGRLSRNPEEACNQHLFFDTAIPSVIIVSAKMGHKERCPLVGKYALVNNNIQSITLQEQPGKYNIFGLGTMYFCFCHPFKGLTYFFSWYKNLFILGYCQP